jgi:hypothetical protein
MVRRERRSRATGDGPCSGFVIRRILQPLSRRTKQWGYGCPISRRRVIVWRHCRTALQKARVHIAYPKGDNNDDTDDGQ